MIDRAISVSIALQIITTKAIVILDDRIGRKHIPFAISVASQTIVLDRDGISRASSPIYTHDRRTAKSRCLGHRTRGHIPETCLSDTASEHFQSIAPGFLEAGVIVLHAECCSAANIDRADCQQNHQPQRHCNQQLNQCKSLLPNPASAIALNKSKPAHGTILVTNCCAVLPASVFSFQEIVTTKLPFAPLTTVPIPAGNMRALLLFQ